MSILNHEWGASPAADRVWAQISGLSPVRIAGRRLLMVFQAFIDDSYGGDVYVLAGHIAPAEEWAKLSAEWEKLLPNFGTLNKHGKYHFKMAEMAKLPERMERVAPFYRLIENHVSMSISAWFRLSDVNRAIRRLYVPGRPLQFGKSLKNFHMAFRGLLEILEANLDQVKPHTDLEFPIDFYFDEQSEKKEILRGWDEYIDNRHDGFRDFIGVAPKFEDDTLFLPLQAADLWAWWVREWHIAGTPEQMERPDFGPFSANRERHLKLDMQCTEQTFVNVFRTALHEQVLTPGEMLYDITYDWER